MIKSEELANPNSCLNKAKDDEMVFVLLARDVAAPRAIRAWIEERMLKGKNEQSDPQVVEALKCAYAMEKYQEKLKKDKRTIPEGDVGWVTQEEEDKRLLEVTIPHMLRGAMLAVRKQHPLACCLQCEGGWSIIKSEFDLSEIYLSGVNKTREFAWFAAAEKIEDCVEKEEKSTETRQDWVISQEEVRKVYPHATCHHSFDLGLPVIYQDKLGMTHQRIAHGNTEQEAWIAAWKKLQEKDQEQPPSYLELTREQSNWLFPVIQISNTGSTMRQIIEEEHTVGTGDNGLAIGWKRIVTKHRNVK